MVIKSNYSHTSKWIDRLEEENTLLRWLYTEIYEEIDQAESNACITIHEIMSEDIWFLVEARWWAKKYRAAWEHGCIDWPEPQLFPWEA